VQTIRYPLSAIRFLMSHSVHLATALEAARAAAEVVRHYYQSNLAVTIKADKSPVTEADVETEKTIRSIIAAKFPAHGFHGEETGSTGMDAEYVWLVDPIVGTKAFVREYPMFSTQIALMHRGAVDRGRLVGRLNRIRGYWDFLQYHLLASGKIDAVVESDVNILDVGACAVIVEAAGGRFTDLAGQTLTLTSASVLATNGRLHEAVLGAIAG